MLELKWDNDLDYGYFPCDEYIKENNLLRLTAEAKQAGYELELSTLDIIKGELKND